MKKKILSLILCFVMLIGLFPISTFAAETGADPYEGYTSVNVSTQEGLLTAINAVNADTPTVIVLGNDQISTYTFPLMLDNPTASMSNKTIVFKADGNVKLDMKRLSDNNCQHLMNATLIFDGLEIEMDHSGWYVSSYVGLGHIKDLAYRNCKISGAQYLNAKTVEFTNCTLESTNSYCITTYGATDVTITGCTFNTAGKAVNVYSGGSRGYTVKVALTNCIFNSDGSVETGKAAVETSDNDNKDSIYIVTITNCTANNFVSNNSTSSLWGNKHFLPHYRLIIILDGAEVTAPLYNEKEDAIEEINKAAEEAKAAIDAMDNLSDEEKTELKNTIDEIVENGKNDIKAAIDIDAINAAKDDAIKDIRKVIEDAAGLNDSRNDSDEDNTTIGSSSGGGFSGSYNYPINIDDVDGATVKASESYAVAGETVTVTVTPDSGKQVDEVIVTDADGNVITVTKVGDDQYSFTMPAGKVNVSVTTTDITYRTKIVLQIDNHNVLVNNRTVYTDATPKIVENRTLVPIRVIVEALGGTADWNEATRTVTLTIDGKVLTLVIDETIPGFGQGATIMDSRTYVPIRYVAEYIGANVEWIEATQQIVILK